MRLSFCLLPPVRAATGAAQVSGAIVIGGLRWWRHHLGVPSVAAARYAAVVERYA
jgi:hypothetical protein